MCRQCDFQGDRGQPCPKQEAEYEAQYNAERDAQDEEGEDNA